MFTEERLDDMRAQVEAGMLQPDQETTLALLNHIRDLRAATRNYQSELETEVESLTFSVKEDLLINGTEEMELQQRISDLVFVKACLGEELE